MGLDRVTDMEASDRWERRPRRQAILVVIGVLAFLLFKQLAWLGIMPLWQTPDEPAHFQYVQYLAETGRLPVFRPTRPTNVSSREVAFTEVNASLNQVAFQPHNQPSFTATTLGPGEERLVQVPLLDRLNDGNSTAAPYPPGYYYPAALAYRLFAHSSVLERVFAVRALSLFFVLVTAWAAFMVAGMLWPSLWVRGAFALLVGCQPMLSMSGVSVNNDAMLIALGSLTALGLANIWQRGAAWWLGPALGLVAALGMLTKPQMLPFVLVVPLAATLSVVWRKEGLVRWTAFMAGYCALFLVAYAPWLLYCKETYGMWMPSLMGPTTAAPTSLWSYGWKWFLQPGLSRTHVLWVVQFWGTFGWLDTVVLDAAYRVVTAFMVVGAFGAWRWIRHSSKLGRMLLLGAGLLSLGFLAFLYLAEYQVVNRTGIPMLQGRYWLPVLVPSMLAVFAGMLHLAPAGRERWTATAIALCAVLFNLVCWLRLIERYYA